MPPLVVLDANVIFPAPLRDLLLWLSYNHLIRAHWTNQIHDEWMRNVETKQKIPRKDLERVRQLMDRHAGDALVTGYAKFESAFPDTDPKDRHVAAAALSVSKNNHDAPVTIVTWNTKDFAQSDLASFSLTKQDPDRFLSGLFKDQASGVLGAIKQQRANLKKPPVTADELLAAFRKQRLDRFVALVEAHTSVI